MIFSVSLLFWKFNWIQFITLALHKCSLFSCGPKFWWWQCWKEMTHNGFETVGKIWRTGYTNSGFIAKDDVLGWFLILIESLVVSNSQIHKFGMLMYCILDFDIASHTNVNYGWAIKTENSPNVLIQSSALCFDLLLMKTRRAFILQTICSLCKKVSCSVFAECLGWFRLQMI